MQMFHLPTRSPPILPPAPGPSKRYRHSRLTTLHHQRGKHRFAASVTYYPGDRLLELHVPIRKHRVALEIRNSLLGTGESRREKTQAKLHFEILGDEGPERFLIRLVRRSPGRHGKHLHKRAQFIFRVHGGAFSVFRDLDDVFRAPDAAFLRPEHLAIIFGQAAKCVIFLRGHEIEVGTLFHAGRVHAVGQDHPDGQRVRKEVIDIN